MPLPSTDWKMPPRLPALAREEIHVWRFSLEPQVAALSKLEGTLSADEIERASRFHFERDRLHFVAARGCLRNILACYLEAEAHQLSFRYSPFGKPELSEEFAGADLQFNLSHSGELGLLAVSCGRSVGVDIERIRTGLADEQVARRFFSPQEVSVLLSLPVSLRREAFFNCWTRKEAYIKALGEGLSMPLDQFDVTLAPYEPALLLGTRPDPGEAARWSLRHLDPSPGYAAALAVRGSIQKLCCWQWQPLVHIPHHKRG